MTHRLDCKDFTARWYRALSCTAYGIACATLLASLAACGEVVAPDDTCEDRTWIPVGLANASFDVDGGWTVDPVDNAPICTPDDFGLPADSGTVAACFGVVNSANQTLIQSVALPPGTTQVRLQGRRCFVTTEQPDAARDTLIIEIQDTSGYQTVATLASWSNLDAAAYCDWSSFSETATLDRLPDAALLSMHGVLDDLEITTFFLDTLALEAYGCAP